MFRFINVSRVGFSESVNPHLQYLLWYCQVANNERIPRPLSKREVHLVQKEDFFRYMIFLLEWCHIVMWNFVILEDVFLPRPLWLFKESCTLAYFYITLNITQAEQLMTRNI